MHEFIVPIRPRYGEVDQMGVVYHAHYLVYFELGRTEYMRSLGASYASIEAAGQRLVVVDAALQFRRPARYDQELVVATQLTQVAGASITFTYELRDAEGTILARGHTRLGCLDESHRPVRLPPELRARLSAGRTGPPGASERT